MLVPVYKESVRIDRIKKFDTELFLFNENQSKPIAFRASDVGKSFVLVSIPHPPSSVIGAFSLYRNNSAFYCTYEGSRKIIAHIANPDTRTVNIIEDYLRKAYGLDPYAISARAAFERFEEIVCIASEFCGCLTDIVHSEEIADRFPIYGASLQNVNCEQIALSLPIVALMFRRISALRGFNFKVTLKDSLPCLIFSAKSLPGKIDTPSDIPEYSALTDILGNDGLVIGVKLKEIDEYTEDGEPLYRLSVAICPQSFDPRGILRASAWRQRVKTLIEDLDIHLEGKY